jgi:hypothetical protein
VGTYDDLYVSGDVTLDGFLDVMLDNFNPAAGNSFDVFSFSGQLLGTFAQVRGIGNSVNWTADYTQAGQVRIQS